MSWISFWIKPEAVPARVTLCVTSLLTLSTQHAQSQKSLPPVSYIKAIDIFMNSCTVFVFASLMEYALVNILMAADERSNHQLNHLLQLSYLNQAGTSSAMGGEAMAGGGGGGGSGVASTHTKTSAAQSPSPNIKSANCGVQLNVNGLNVLHSNSVPLHLAELNAFQSLTNDPHNYNGNYYSGRHALYACPFPAKKDFRTIPGARLGNSVSSSNVPQSQRACDYSEITVTGPSSVEISTCERNTGGDRNSIGSGDTGESNSCSLHGTRPTDRRATSAATTASPGCESAGCVLDPGCSCSGCTTDTAVNNVGNGTIQQPNAGAGNTSTNNNLNIINNNNHPHNFSGRCRTCNGKQKNDSIRRRCKEPPNLSNTPHLSQPLPSSHQTHPPPPSSPSQPQQHHHHHQPLPQRNASHRKCHHHRQHHSNFRVNSKSKYKKSD